MAYGSVNVPGVNHQELDAVKAAVQTAQSTANAAKAAAVVMKGASASAAGAAGLAPAPAAGAQGKYLRGDGTWQTPPDTNTTYTPASAAPKANGTAAVGTSAKYAREDHVHPAQTTVSGNAATATRLATVTFTVAGDKTKYYPCLITTGGYAWNHINIYRGYADTAPTDWGTDANHKGGLTLCVRWSGDSGWGGNDHTVVVDEFSETYCKMVGGLALSVNGLIVWLRGGSALYRISSENGGTTAVSVKLDTYTASDKRTYAPRAYDAAVVANEVTARWKDRHGTYNGNVTGNAATATKLATARTINGVAFDGSANINVKGFAAQSSAPGNTSLLWIDTTAKTGGLKYHNGSAWVSVPVAYT